MNRVPPISVGSLLNNLPLVLVLIVGIGEFVVVLVLMIGVIVEFKVVAIIAESESLKKNYVKQNHILAF